MSVTEYVDAAEFHCLNWARYCRLSDAGVYLSMMKTGAAGTSGRACKTSEDFAAEVNKGAAMAMQAILDGLEAFQRQAFETVYLGHRWTRLGDPDLVVEHAKPKVYRLLNGRGYF